MSYVSFRLVPKSVTLNDLERCNGVMVVTLRYFTEFGKSAFQHMTTSTCGLWRNLCRPPSRRRKPP